MDRPSYHHGDLRAVILGHAAQLVAERGANGISLRELARAAGVSHAAPAHHFTDRRGLFTALAAQGFRLLAEALNDVRGDFAAAAVAYVRFALDHPGHYQVMFNRPLLDSANTELAEAETAAATELARGVETLSDTRARADPGAAQLAAWSLVHGFSTLWLNDAVNADVKATDPQDTVMRIATMLFEG
ncbi:TetR/AcrR family transcriptional regulator [Mycobacterium sherrisii]|uniref:TetR family transcriptional regulator n=1 Tax=Mycobacterium sherrisii TaxID=243061 RepID=A0A1E3SPI4_9MYCO|nr:TetR/AcrR family transcriptional regulator [Mycobacterium sherrisii]MCV7027779.1 TetR/AcrR family transcriptional regulator [Mycobacterium sherrisii]ODR04012.1 TetR family transcriptional regulator [Mycobacterium sherrisii]ORW84423.1 TetR family transcriptional regulator [Mycobacterium sherrisii]